MWKQGWFFLKRLIERNCTNYKNVVFFGRGGTYPSSWGDPWQGLLCSFFLSPQKKSGWKTKVWYLAYANHQWILCALVIFAFWCLTKLLWVECLLLTHLWSFSGQVLWMLCLQSWENQPIVMTSIQGKRRGRCDLVWEREKEGRALGMTKSGCFRCDIAFNVQNLTLTMSGALCGPYKLLTERLLKY